MFTFLDDTAIKEEDNEVIFKNKNGKKETCRFHSTTYYPSDWFIRPSSEKASTTLGHSESA